MLEETTSPGSISSGELSRILKTRELSTSSEYSVSEKKDQTSSFMRLNQAAKILQGLKELTENENTLSNNIFSEGKTDGSSATRTNSSNIVRNVQQGKEKGLVKVIKTDIADNDRDHSVFPESKQNVNDQRFSTLKKDECSYMSVSEGALYEKNLIINSSTESLINNLSIEEYDEGS